MGVTEKMYFFLGANIDLLSLYQYLPFGSINLSVDLDKSQQSPQNLRVFVCAALVPRLSLDSVLINPYLQEVLTQAVGMPSGVKLLGVSPRHWRRNAEVKLSQCFLENP